MSVSFSIISPERRRGSGAVRVLVQHAHASRDLRQSDEVELESGPQHRHRQRRPESVHDADVVPFAPAHLHQRHGRQAHVVRAAAGQTRPGEGLACGARCAAPGAPGQVARPGRGAGSPAAAVARPQVGHYEEEEARVSAVPAPDGVAAHPGAGARDGHAPGAAEGVVPDGRFGAGRHAVRAAAGIAVAPAAAAATDAVDVRTAVRSSAASAATAATDANANGRTSAAAAATAAPTANLWRCGSAAAAAIAAANHANGTRWRRHSECDATNAAAEWCIYDAGTNAGHATAATGHDAGAAAAALPNTSAATAATTAADSTATTAAHSGDDLGAGCCCCCSRCASTSANGCTDNCCCCCRRGTRAARSSCRRAASGSRTHQFRLNNACSAAYILQFYLPHIMLLDLDNPHIYEQ